ncbi:MAG: ribosome small subunit-dependent GTPase A [Terriglobia bacterium]
MTPREDRPAHSDLRHRNRQQRLEARVAAKPKAKTKKAAASGVEDAVTSSALVVGIGPGLCFASMEADPSGELHNVRCDLQVVPGDVISIKRGKVSAIAPRRTVLSRADPANPNRDLLIAANIDILVIVAAVADPPFRPGLVDRYLVAAARAGITPILCLNKIDLDHGEDIAAVFQIPTVRCSAATGRGIDELSDLLAGNLAVFAGHSGVGKSSLLNALAGENHARTGIVGDVTRRGRQTTTSSRLYQLPNGARIIDTAGIREFGLGRLTLAELRDVFPDFHAQGCRFSDCTHRHEPGCPVRAAGGDRYADYLRLASDL